MTAQRHMMTGARHARAESPARGACYEKGMPVLCNVYHVHCEVGKETKAASNVLVKRGKEWHGDKMYLNPQHILPMEPVSPASRVSDLVRAAKD